MRIYLETFWSKLGTFFWHRSSVLPKHILLEALRPINRRWQQSTKSATTQLTAFMYWARCVSPSSAVCGHSCSVYDRLACYLSLLPNALLLNQNSCKRFLIFLFQLFFSRPNAADGDKCYRVGCWQSDRCYGQSNSVCDNSHCGRTSGFSSTPWKQINCQIRYSFEIHSILRLFASLCLFVVCHVVYCDLTM